MESHSSGRSSSSEFIGIRKAQAPKLVLVDGIYIRKSMQYLSNSSAVQLKCGYLTLADGMIAQAAGMFCIRGNLRMTESGASS